MTEGEVFGVAGNPVDMTDHHVVDDQQDEEGDQQSLDGLRDEDQHRLFDESVVDHLQRGGDEQLANRLSLVDQVELAGDVIAGQLLPHGLQTNLLVAHGLLDLDKLHGGEIHDAFELYLDLFFIQVPQTGGNGLQKRGFDLIQAAFHHAAILAVVPEQLQHGDDDGQQGATSQDVGEQPKGKAVSG